MKDTIKVGGFFRLQIVEVGKGKKKVVGDSGWLKNQLTNLGAQHFICEVLGAIAGSSLPSFFALGTGTAPASTATNLPGELTDAAGMRFSFGTASVVASRTIQFTGNLASSIITAQRTIQNIGIFGISNITSGSIFVGNTYTTSALATNQSVNVTYQLKFP